MIYYPLASETIVISGNFNFALGFEVDRHNMLDACLVNNTGLNGSTLIAGAFQSMV